MSEREPGDWELADLHDRDIDGATPAEPAVQPVILGGRVIGETILGRGTWRYGGYLHRDNKKIYCGYHATRADAEQAVREAAIVAHFRANPNAPVWAHITERES